MDDALGTIIPGAFSDQDRVDTADLPVQVKDEADQNWQENAYQGKPEDSGGAGAGGTWTEVKDPQNLEKYADVKDPYLEARAFLSESRESSSNYEAASVKAETYTPPAERGESSYSYESSNSESKSSSYSDSNSSYDSGSSSSYDSGSSSCDSGSSDGGGGGGD